MAQDSLHEMHRGASIERMATVAMPEPTRHAPARRAAARAILNACDVLSGDPLRETRRWAAISLDRIDPSRNYTIDNVHRHRDRHHPFCAICRRQLRCKYAKHPLIIPRLQRHVQRLMQSARSALTQEKDVGAV